jgi:drug/metabolite transporter (DMT)-like permease
MKSSRIFILTLAAMIAFASNSLLCRLALKQTGIDPASFTLIRIFSGAVALWLIMQMRERFTVERTASPSVDEREASEKFPSPPPSPNGRGGPFSPREKARMRVSSRKVAGNWLSAFALFAYAGAFSFAYVDLSAGTGALLLFGAVQATMILWGLHKGERFDAIQVMGFVIAMIGLVVLIFPGLTAPALFESILMVGAGVAWGIYSLRGQTGRNPIGSTAGNFLRAVPFAVAVSIIFFSRARLDHTGIFYAIVSGAVTSGLGYVMWYSALSGLKATSAATVQLSVPVLAAAGGILLLGEPITLRYVLASLAVLGGIFLVVIEKRQRGESSQTT